MDNPSVAMSRKPARYNNFQEIMRDFLKGENFQKLSAMRYIHEFAEHELVIDTLIRYLEDESTYISKYAIRALGNCGTRGLKAYDALWDMATGKTSLYEREALLALAKLLPADKDVHVAVMKGLEDYGDIVQFSETLIDIDREILLATVQTLEQKTHYARELAIMRVSTTKNEVSIQQLMNGLENNRRGIEKEYDAIRDVFQSSPIDWALMEKKVKALRRKLAMV